MRCTLAPIIMEMENGALEDEFSLRKVIVGKSYHIQIIQLAHSVVYEAKLVWHLLNVFSLPGNAYKACKNQLVFLMSFVATSLLFGMSNLVLSHHRQQKLVGKSTCRGPLNTPD